MFFIHFFNFFCNIEFVTELKITWSKLTNVLVVLLAFVFLIFDTIVFLKNILIYEKMYNFCTNSYIAH